MTIIDLHVRAEDYDNPDTRHRLESDIFEAGWRIVSIDPPVPGLDVYVYKLALVETLSETGEEVPITWLYYCVTDDLSVQVGATRRPSMPPACPVCRQPMKLGGVIGADGQKRDEPTS